MANDKCDCLNECGDDPWILKRKAKPCGQFVLQHADLCRREKLAPEEELIPVFREIAQARLREAEKAWHDYFTILPIGDQRTQAAEVFENVRNAARVGKP